MSGDSLTEPHTWLCRACTSSPGAECATPSCSQPAAHSSTTAARPSAAEAATDRACRRPAARASKRVLPGLGTRRSAARAAQHWQRRSRAGCQSTAGLAQCCPELPSAASASAVAGAALLLLPGSDTHPHLQPAICSLLSAACSAWSCSACGHSRALLMHAVVTEACL